MKIIFYCLVIMTLIDLDNCPNQSTRIYPVFDNSDWKIIDKEGQQVIGMLIQDVRTSQDGIYKILSTSWGFLDTSGQWVYYPQARDLDDFVNDYARVRKSTGSGLINKNGEEVIPLQYERIGQYSEGLVAVRQEGRWGYMDCEGKWKIKPQFNNPIEIDDEMYSFNLPSEAYGVSHFSEGLAAVRENDKWGFIDKTGRMVIEPIYDVIAPFSEGLAAVAVDNKMGFINQYGELIIKPILDIHYSNKEFGITRRDDIDPNSSDRILLSETRAICKDGMIPASINGGWAFFDKKGLQNYRFFIQ